MSISPSERAPSRTVVIGVGNPLLGDDGLGLAALEQLRERWALPSAVDLVDGGTWGLSLLPAIEDAARLLLLDAIDVGAAAGTAVEISREQLPRYLASKLSPHQIDLSDVFAVAELRGTMPRTAMALGVQPARVELRDGLTDVVGAQLADLVLRAVTVLTHWGHACAERGAADRSGGYARACVTQARNAE